MGECQVCRGTPHAVAETHRGSGVPPRVFAHRQGKAKARGGTPLPHKHRRQNSKVKASAATLTFRQSLPVKKDLISIAYIQMGVMDV